MSVQRSDAAEPGASDPLVRALRQLTAGYGVRSASLHQDLGPELRQVLHIPDDDHDVPRTLARVSWQLDRLIRQQLVSSDLQQIARISYNLGVPAIRELRLVERREWLHRELRRLSPSESQRELRQTIVPLFADSLRRDPPPAPTDAALADVLAAERGQPVGNHLPPSKGAVDEAVPPSVIQAEGKQVKISLVITVVAAIVTIIVGVKVLPATSRDLDADSADGPSAPGLGDDASDC